MKRILLLLTALCVAVNVSAVQEKRYFLRDNMPAKLDIKGWERDSYPQGNGYLGISVFGGIDEELWQFTEKSVFVSHPKSPKGKTRGFPGIGFSSLGELRLLQSHDPEKVQNYARELDLKTAMGTTRYDLGGVSYLRETLASYPDRCFVGRISASKPGTVSFRLKVLPVYVNESRTAKTEVLGDTIVLSGKAKPYGLKYEVRVAVECQGGKLTASSNGPDGELVVEGADEAVVFMTVGTNYRLEPKVFDATEDETRERLEGYEVPSGEIKNRLLAARAKGWNDLKTRHQADVGRLFDRTGIDLGGVDPGIPTRVLLQDAKANAPAPAERYLEELYFQFGRYLLFSSSRKDTMPANLQGSWNMHMRAPWSGGYWANINLQMNYWPAFSTGLEECFSPYYELFHAMFEQGQKRTERPYERWGIKTSNKDNGAWTAGTGNTPYKTDGPGGTSLAGSGPFVILPLWDWYLYTGKTEVLEKVWPFLLCSSRFLVDALVEQPDGTLLCVPSCSPENHVKEAVKGTAYDQQLVYESFRMTLEAARVLKKSDPILATLEAHLPKLSPVLIGADGQIKEFREETHYGEFGEKNHRHISHLISLFPGTLITERKDWLEAAKVTLNMRGDRSTGWAMAHRLNAWTRIKDGERCLKLLQTLLEKGTLPNLWDTHAPFQIDGNFGGCSGIAEMLLQSHEGFIDLLPAVPAAWMNGSFDGIRTKGGHSVSATWKCNILTSVSVVSEWGETCRIRNARVLKWAVTSSDGTSQAAAFDKATGVLEFKTVPGQTYRLLPVEKAKYELKFLNGSFEDAAIQTLQTGAYKDNNSELGYATASNPDNIQACGLSGWTATSRMWYQAATNTTQTPIATFPDGDWCARLDGSDRHNGIDVLAQSGLILEAGTTYELTFDMWGEGSGTTAGLDVRFTHGFSDVLDYTDGTGVTVLDEKTTVADDGVAERVTVTFTPAVSANYALQFFIDAPGGSHVWIDDVRLGEHISKAETPRHQSKAR